MLIPSSILSGKIAGKSVWLLMVAVLVSFGAAQEPVDGRAQAGAQRPGTGAPQPWFQQRHPRYLLRPGDSFDLTFQFSPQFNQTVSVQPDGFVSLKGIGDMHVAGLTVPQVTDQLKSAYGQFLREPELFLVLKDFEKPFVTVGGQVNHPGRYDLRGDTTLAEAIQMAGGFNTTSKHSQVVVFHKVSDEWAETRVVDVKKMMAHRDLREDVRLSPGDMIFVPQNKISKIKQYIPLAVANATVNPATL